MNIGKIVKYSLKYPFSNWKNFLFLGIILLLSSLTSVDDVASLLTRNISIIWILGIIGFLIEVLSDGYLFKVIKSSLNDEVALPDFDNWVKMFIDGIKVNLTLFVYSIPAFLIIVFAVLLFTSVTSTINLLSGGLISFFIGVPGLGNLIAGAGTGFFIAILYEIIIFPILLMAIANMANDESKFTAAFKFKEIFNKIGDIGWGAITIWYILTGIILLALFGMGVFITFFFSLISASLAEILLMIILIPYILIYLARSVALFYMS